MGLALLRDLHSICIFIAAIKLLDISKWHCEDLNSYQTITFLLQTKRLNQLTLTPLTTTVYLSHLSNPTPSHHLSSIHLPKCMKNDGCFMFLQEIGKRITKSTFTVLKQETIFLIISKSEKCPLILWLNLLCIY